MTTPADRYASFRERQADPEFASFRALYDFAFDDFQVAACGALSAGDGVLVAAPTGSGKTVIGEYAVHLALAQGRKCFYTTPIKALSNQKYADLVRRYDSQTVGLLTGDNSINSGAPVVVMTTEVLRNMLYTGSTALAGLGYVVLDEVHYLADRSRGAVWEEVIIHLPESVRVVALSATVSNAEEFGEWLDQVRGGTSVIVDEHRPVPLWQHVLAGNRLYDLFTDTVLTAGSAGEGHPRVNPELLRVAQRDTWIARKAPARPVRGGSTGRRPRRFPLSYRPDVIARLDASGLLPAITFIFSRAGCNAAVEQCLAAGLRLTTPEEAEAIQRTAERRTADIPPEDLAVLGYGEWLDGLRRGIAAHHAGMLPAFKEVVEELFAAGLVRAVFATETLALGINMPARTVVIEKLDKWNGETHANLTAGEYTQLTGRAGRRGIDVEGHAVVLWQPGTDPVEVAGLASTRTYPLNSSFRPSYNMAVNLTGWAGRPRASALLESSFAQFQADRGVVGLTRQVRKNRQAMAELAAAMTCEKGDFAEYAQIRRSLSEREGDLSRARATCRRAEAARSLSLLRPGDIIRVPGGRRAGMAGVLQPGLHPGRGRRPPCHDRPDREAHGRYAERYMRLKRETEALERRVAGRSHVIAPTFDRVCSVLERLGYLAGDTVTPDGQRLGRLYTELDLLAAECLRCGQWDGLSPAELAACVSALSFESRHADDAQPPRLPKGRVPETLAAMVRTWGELDQLEKDNDLSFLRQPDLGFAWAAYRWARGTRLETVLDEAPDPTPGDFARSVKQLIDLLDQIASAIPAAPPDPPDPQDDPSTSPTLATTARAAIDAMRRGVIAYSAVAD